MKKEEVEEKLKKLICDKIGIEEEDYTLDSHLKNDFGLDSLDIVEFVMEVEKEFDVSIDDDELEKISTVEYSVDLILKEME